MMDGRVMRKVAALQLGTCNATGLKKGVHQEVQQGYIKGCGRGMVGLTGCERDATGVL